MRCAGNAVVEATGSAAALKQALITRARAEGFDVVGVTAPGAVVQAGEWLAAFLEAGHHGDMAWMAERAKLRADPQALWPEVRSVVMLGMNYGPDRDPLSIQQAPYRAAFSVYARGRDYHDVIKGKLKTLASWLHAQTGAELKVFVDTAPVMEKPLAQAAGIGWQGKHTNLVSREFGSWLFLGAIFTAAHLPPDEPEHNHCGSCRRCLDACPTAAFLAPYRLDARRCISYLTIEHKGHIPREFRGAIGNRVYGCDDCLAVCPWNRFASAAREAKFAARPMIGAPLRELLALDDAAFRAAFAGTGIKRIGRDRFIRNVLIATGNSGDMYLTEHVVLLLGDENPLVRAMAVWALRRLYDPGTIGELRDAYFAGEADETVRAEWLCEDD